jgi:hypothetical protein
MSERVKVNNDVGPETAAEKAARIRAEEARLEEKFGGDPTKAKSYVPEAPPEVVNPEPVIGVPPIDKQPLAELIAPVDTEDLFD